MGVRDRSFWKGVNRTAVPSMQEVMQSELAKKLFKENRQLVNLEEDEDNRMESKSLQESIIGDTSLTPEERAQFASQFGDGKKGLSKESRTRIKGSYDTYKTDKKKVADETAKKETAAADKKAAAKLKFDALKAEAENLGPEAKKSMASYLSMTDPNEVAVDRFEKAIERHYTAAGKTPDKPNETETKIGLVKKATEIGGGDPYKGWQIIKEQDPTTYYEAQQRGIKTEREDKASPKAEKLLEDVQGEWQYEKDRYAETVRNAQKAVNEKKAGGKTVEELVSESNVTDPGPMSLFAFKYLSDRKQFLNEDAVNEAFHRLNKDAGTDKTERGMLPAGKMGEAAGPGPTASGGAPAGSAATGTVSAGQEADLQGKLSRADAILQKLEEEMGLKK